MITLTTSQSFNKYSAAGKPVAKRSIEKTQRKFDLKIGIADVAALIAIFGVNSSMILFGWLQEKYEQPGSGGLMPFVFGCITGVVPWIVVAVYVIAPGSTSGAETPIFVYGIIVSLFLFFNSFALVQYLQYKQVGKWANYRYGERAYIFLSLIAKSILAWQIFAGTLAS